MKNKKANKIKKSENGLKGIDLCFAEIKKQRTDNDQKKREYYESALNEVRSICGYKEIGDYTLQDAIDFLTRKYGAKKITVEEAKDYVKIDFSYNEDNFISSLTEEYIGDNNYAGPFLLPAQSEHMLKGNRKKNGAVLFLDYMDDKVDFWWLGGNRNGYYGLQWELNVFEGITWENLSKKVIMINRFD